MPSPFKITICGIDELTLHAASGTTHVLSILDPETPEPEAFGRFNEHARLELRFHDVIEATIPGLDPPQPHHIEALLGFGRDMMRDAGPAANLLVHCHMGISRSTAAAVLILSAAQPDRPPADIMADIAGIRPKAWPNLRMIEIGDRMLGHRGALVSAVRERHREVARAQPLVVDFMRQSGRGRELD